MVKWNRSKCGVKMLKCIIAAQVVTSCYWMLCVACEEYLQAFAKLETPATPRVRGGNMIWFRGPFNQSEARDGQIWPIRGKMVGDLRNMNQEKETQENCGLVFFLSISIPDYWVYLLSSEPWMGLELPFFAVILPTADDRLDILWHKTAGKSRNKFGPITRSTSHNEGCFVQ